MNSKSIFVTIIALYLTLTAYAQNESRDIVNKYYPQVYQSISQFAQRSWQNEPEMQENVLQSQSEAFLDLVESKIELNQEVLVAAILDNSFIGEEEHNKQIINDKTIKNHFSHLGCNWYMVKDQYEKATHTSLTNPHLDTYPSLANSSLRETNGSRIKYSYHQPSNTALNEEEEELPLKTKKSTLGIRVGYGISSVKGFSNYGTIKKNKIYDFALINNYKSSKIVFVQTDLSFDHISMDLYDDTRKYDIIVNKISLRLYPGLYKTVTPNVKIMAGIGGFLGLITRNKQQELLLKEKPVSIGLAGYDYGINGLAAVEANHIQISIVATMSLQNISNYNLGLRGRSVFLALSYLF